QAEDGIRYFHVTGVQTCALPICLLACTAFVPLEDVMAFLNKKRTLDDFVPEQRESLEQAIADLKAAPLYVAEASDLRGGITDVKIGRAAGREREELLVEGGVGGL